jgi:hypothetical protein
MNDPEPEISRYGKTPGQFVVGAMLLIALLMATCAWVVNYGRGNHALDFYGPEGAILLRKAPIVEYLRPQPDGPIDISKAPGLINARAALLSDAGYDWTATDVVQESPLFSVRFRREEQSLVITFDFENRTLHASTTQRTARLNKKTSDGWQSYLSRNAKTSPPASP